MNLGQMGYLLSITTPALPAPSSYKPMIHQRAMPSTGPRLGSRCDNPFGDELALDWYNIWAGFWPGLVDKTGV